MLAAIIIIAAIMIILCFSAAVGIACYAIFKYTLYRTRLQIGKDPRTGKWINLPTERTK
jgi:hypothetical protein